MNHETNLIRQYIEEDLALMEGIVRAAKYAESIGIDDCIRPAVAVLIKHHFENAIPIVGLGGDLILAGLAQVDWMALSDHFIAGTS